MDWSYEKVEDLWEDRECSRKAKKSRVNWVVLVSLIAGVTLGYIMVMFFPRTITINRAIFIILFFIILYISSTLHIIILFFIILYISSTLHIIIHESGHLFFGLRSNYQFVSFRVYAFTFYEKDGKVRIKRCKVPGTGGQCLLLPPKDYNEDTCPYTLYNLGGVIFNFIASCISIPFAILFDHSWVRLPLVMFIFLGFYYVALNAIPFPQIQNDGCNLRDLKRDSISRRSFYKQLIVNQQLLMGMELNDLKDEDILLPKGADITQPLNSYFISIQYLKLLAEQNYEKLDEALLISESVYEKLPSKIKILTDAERLHLMMMNYEDIRSCKTYYKYTKKAMRRNIIIPDVLRTLYCYELLIHKDEKKAAGLRKRMERYKKTSPFQQEIGIQLYLMNMADERYEQQKISESLLKEEVVDK